MPNFFFWADFGSFLFSFNWLVKAEKKEERRKDVKQKGGWQTP